jgi:hypothetical protein
MPRSNVCVTPTTHSAPAGPSHLVVDGAGLDRPGTTANTSHGIERFGTTTRK